MITNELYRIHYNVYLGYIGYDVDYNVHPGYIGYDADRTKGIFLPGGSMCTLFGMVLARYKMFPESKEKGVSHPIQVNQPV